MKNRFPVILIILSLLILTIVAIVKTGEIAPHPVAFESNPVGIMGTTCRLIVVDMPKRASEAETALKEAENVIRRIESQMSYYIEDSELSKVNKHPAGIVTVGDDLANVLNISLNVYKSSAGAFDITCSPMISLWKKGAYENRIPQMNELAWAKNGSQMRFFKPTSTKNQFEKLKDSVTLDLGGIAKGYAIQKAIEGLKKYNFKGGLVDIGGDTACFGESTDGKWHYGVVNPFDKSILVKLDIANKSVCTSGNYNRFFDIDGEKYSHIIDPRTGYPAEKTSSVTIIADDASYADAWATAASVLSYDALLLSREHEIEAMIITGTAENCTVYLSEFFKEYLVGDLPKEWKVVR